MIQQQMPVRLAGDRRGCFVNPSEAVVIAHVACRWNLSVAHGNEGPASDGRRLELQRVDSLRGTDRLVEASSTVSSPTRNSNVVSICSTVWRLSRSASSATIGHLRPRDRHRSSTSVACFGIDASAEATTSTPTVARHAKEEPLSTIGEALRVCLDTKGICSVVGACRALIRDWLWQGAVSSTGWNRTEPIGLLRNQDASMAGYQATA